MTARRLTYGLLIAIVLAPLLVGTAGCASDRLDTLGPGVPHGVPAPGAVAVNGIMNEWTVQVDLASVRRGPVTFTITNTGTVLHEFLVVRTDVPVGALVLVGDHFDEEGSLVNVVKEIPDVAAKATGTATVTLEPGRYQLVCNQPGHYALGMYTGFTVTS